MVYLYLFLEFFKIGLFALGGGPATLPFLAELVNKYDWYTASELADFVAISEGTPGPLGVNMATYAGYNAGGLLGGVVATAGLVLPSLIIITVIAKFLKNFSKNRIVRGVFYAMRPAVTALIVSAVIGIFTISLFTDKSGGFAVNVPLVIICVAAFGLMQMKKLKKLHPAVWLVTAAAIGIIFKL